MIIIDYYQAERNPIRKSRFEITKHTKSYDPFESILINKRGLNVGGLSFNLVNRSEKWKGEDKADKAITKGNMNITSVYFPNVEQPIAYGDMNGTNDAFILKFNPDTENGLNTVEIFIFRGQKHNQRNIWMMFCEGEYDDEIEQLIKNL